jgi:hypothetical protein
LNKEDGMTAATPDATATPRYRDAVNLVPLPYRRVSVQRHDGPLTEEALVAHFMDREAYRRTDFVVLRGVDGQTAVIAITCADREPLFSPITSVELVAGPGTCRYVVDAATDTGNRSAMADLARRLGVGRNETLVVEGRFDHVNFIHRPDPLVVRIVEVTPPDPPKILELARHVLSYADLPPIVLEFEPIDVRELCLSVKPAAYLLPCRSGGLDDLGAPVHFLDERPAVREDWTLIGCERSIQFHRHYYGDEPPRVEMCPRVIAGARDEPTLLKCCLLEFHVEVEGAVLTVPWGSDLVMVENALRQLSSEVIYA